MKLKIFTLVLLLFALLNVDAQEFFYYSYNGKIPINLDKKSITLNAYSDFDPSSIRDANLKSFELLTDYTDKNYKYATTEISNNLSAEEYFKFINRLNSNSRIIKVNPNFTNDRGQKLGLSNYLYVKLKSKEDYSLLKSKAAELFIDIIEQDQFMPLWYTLKITKRTPVNTLQAANSLYETGSFASSQPDFMSDDLQCTNDPMFGSLWGMPAINACQAWTLSQGDGVTVAVLDVGIEKTHGDLSANIHPLSYDTESNSSPSQIFGDHGTHCAGTIGAVKDNNLQVVGVAPKSKLMAVSNSLAATTNSRKKRGNGINWAWQNGADIISNSWGSSVQFDEITDAIANAIQNGRNGKGTIVVFASGNEYGAVAYPAKINPDILAVGATTSTGTRAGFSNYGNELDVVAPGSGILSTVLNNGTGTKDGTSMATPHVAGVAALILSVNPCLTGKQVRDIIEKTAQKIRPDLYSYTTTPGKPNGTWNNQMGYGLVNAYAAVEMAKKVNNLAAFDSAADIGLEPNPSANTWANIYQSNDIWNRVTNDNINITHENPGYAGPGKNVMRFRVRNIGCTTSSPGFARLYWTMGSTGESWPESWNGVRTLGPYPYYSAGGELTDPYTGFNSSNQYSPGQGFKIPALSPGQVYIIDAKWSPVDPTIYGANQDNVICFLGRIVYANDPMYDENPGPNAPIEPNVTKNNNIVTRNTRLVNLSGVFSKRSGFFIGNYLDVERLFDVRLQLIKDSNVQFKSIATLFVTLDNQIWERWKESGFQSEGIEIVNQNTHEIKVINPQTAILKKIRLKPEEYFPLTLNFTLQTSIGSMEDYDFAASQYVSDEQDKQYGSVCHFLVAINQKEKPGEPYCEDGCKETNKQISVLKDVKLSPNPASSRTTLEVNLLEDASASILLTDFNGKTLKKIINSEKLNKGINTREFSVSELPDGVYVITILVNSERKSVNLIVKH
ncbi:S8 family serine peptidase [Chryseobacterium paridis]|uniref:S8 family peptidase n=1 Tax=Chryseobacterium paridis TaxID=2800328 RepID=A0ABS1FWD2_9FLAO|nr:S8 family serine peptidase [Chryseobacterium paridis]MBK1896753.1 S8 family peptidase [Chryseobacterium paridis]